MKVTLKCRSQSQIDFATEMAHDFFKDDDFWDFDIHLKEPNDEKSEIFLNGIKIPNPDTLEVLYHLTALRKAFALEFNSSVSA